MIVFAHLLNDRSGSARILKTVIQATRTDETALLFLGAKTAGLLDDAGIETRRYWYRRTGNRVLTFISLLLSQAVLFLSLLRERKIARGAVIYVNTLLPFGAALYGWATRRPVIYHLHEVSLSPPVFRRFLVAIARLTATRLIYVSDTHRDQLPIAPDRSCTVHNAIEPALEQAAGRHRYRHRIDGRFVVLMLASNRRYKGLAEFLRLAERLSAREDLAFHLVLSDGGTPQDGPPIPANVTIRPPTSDPAHYYAGASLVLNLSRPDLWIETFGLTLLEGMAFGTPVICPPVGGPAELVRDGKEGFLIDCRDADALAAAVTRLADDAELSTTMSGSALARAAQFRSDALRRSIAEVLDSCGGTGRR